MHAIMKAVFASAIFAAMPASAATLVNGLPTGTLNEGYWTNESSSQNFLVSFTLASASDITGFEILEGTGFSTIGDALRIKIRNDVAGSPALANAFSFVDQIDAISTYQSGILKVTTNFAPITLAAGTYWFGVSGAGNTQVWASYNNGGPASPTNQRQLNGDTIVSTPSINSLAFTVLGNVAAVPEPATWGMMILGFGMVGASARYRRRTAKVAFA